jgi:hypothetical protein
MTFKLQPGDWIPTAEVPEDKRQAVIDAFVADGCKKNEWIDTGDFDDYACIGWDVNEDRLNCWDHKYWPDLSVRRVTLSQILGEQSPSWDDVGPELLQASINLRIAQKTYMKNRGNDKYGNDVAYYAAVLDDAIAKAKEIKCT